jgi:hypothetical protein
MTPWLCVLHFVMQAVTVLLIQVVIGQVADRNRDGKKRNGGDAQEETTPEMVLEGAKKGVRWLHSMGKRDASAERAFRITERFFRRIAAAKGLDMNGVPVSNDDGRHDLGQSSTGREQWRRHYRQDDMNWGPDRTVSEGGSEMHEGASFALDPIFFSAEIGHGAAEKESDG